jgi:hypothetical protein
VTETEPDGDGDGDASSLKPDVAETEALADGVGDGVALTDTNADTVELITEELAEAVAETDTGTDGDAVGSALKPLVGDAEPLVDVEAVVDGATETEPDGDGDNDASALKLIVAEPDELFDDVENGEEGVMLAEIVVDCVADGVTLSVLGDGDGVTLVEALPETDCVAAAVFVVLEDSLGETLGVVETDGGMKVPKILKGLTIKYSAADGSRFVLKSRTHITARLLALDGSATEKAMKANAVTLPIFTASLVVYAASGAVTTTSTKELRPADVKPPLDGILTVTSTLIAWYPVVDVQN